MRKLPDSLQFVVSYALMTLLTTATAATTF